MLLLFGVKRAAGPAGSCYRILASDWPTLLSHSLDSLLPSPFSPAFETEFSTQINGWTLCWVPSPPDNSPLMLGDSSQTTEYSVVIGLIERLCNCVEFYAN